MSRRELAWQTAGIIGAIILTAAIACPLINGATW